jgi:type II secretory pathway predicted ATPase ExeA
MDEHYRAFFGFVREPFATDISYAEILKTPELESVKVSFDYIMRLGAIGVVTGEVGSGKSTAVRYALNTLHPSEYRSLYITASSGSIMEFYRQLRDALDIYLSSNSKAVMVKTIKKEIVNLVCDKKMKVILTVDEASLMRLEVFAELHTICQFEQDAKPWLPIWKRQPKIDHL